MIFFFFQEISVGIEDDSDCSIYPGDSASVCLIMLITSFVVNVLAFKASNPLTNHDALPGPGII